MDIILIPGFWLDASSWDAIAPGLAGPGRVVRAVTLPGLESRDANRRGIGLRDHVRAVRELVDHASGPVVLVGHSGGGAVAQAVTDDRPDRIARVIYVDAIPQASGQCINDELPVVGDEIPLPDWSVFDDADLVDLNEDLRIDFRRRAIPEPAAVAGDQLVLSDVRRLDVPVTVIACEFSNEQLEGLMADGVAWTAELRAVRERDVVELPTGHWPQFTKPRELVDALCSILARVENDLRGDDSAR